jgi:inner membrane protein involved in colicin E2 resistance
LTLQNKVLYYDFMIRRIAAIGFIFISTAVAWGILSATIFSRTEGYGAGLRDKVAGIWGGEQVATPPLVEFSHVETNKVSSVVNGKNVIEVTQVPVTSHPPLESSHLDAGIDLDYRQKGLLWYSTYKVAFAGEYVFRNAGDKTEQLSLRLQLPATQSVYDGLEFKLNGQTMRVSHAGNNAVASAVLEPGTVARLSVKYRSQGLGTWTYSFGEGVSQVRDFRLRMRTNFADIDFSENALAPTSKQRAGSGWDLEWAYQDLVSGYHIALVMPEKLQPGPLAGAISLFAPVSLFFFFFVLLMVTTIRKIDLHPMNYFFLAAAFFAFHLLLAYLVDHISIHWAFLLSSVISVFLVVSYLRLVAGLQFAAFVAGGAQLLYLVLFSYAFFFKGLTGLTITIGAIITLFVAMQMTGRIKWSEQSATATVLS